MIQSRQVDYAKEVDDVLALLIGIVADVKAGKSIGDVASGNIAKLVDALAGVDQVGGEIAANRKVALETIGWRAGELTDAILGAPTAP